MDPREIYKLKSRLRHASYLLLSVAIGAFPEKVTRWVSRSHRLALLQKLEQLPRLLLSKEPMLILRLRKRLSATTFSTALPKTLFHERGYLLSL